MCRPNPKHAPTSKRKKQEPPIVGSPDDPFPADPDETSRRPAQLEK